MVDRFADPEFVRSSLFRRSQAGQRSRKCRGRSWRDDNRGDAVFCTYSRKCDESSVRISSIPIMRTVKYEWSRFDAF